jgi:hypothetical protein
MASDIGPIKLNHGTLQAILDGGSGMAGVLQSDAAKVLSRAQALAPVESGDYKRSLHIETGHTDRMVVRVVADVRKKGKFPYGLMVEREHHVLAKALAASGGRPGR